MLRTIVALPLAFCLTVATAPRASADEDGLLRTITVQGRGEIASVPDVAMVVAGVVTTKPNVADAIAENSRTVANIIALARERGIANRDLQTADFSVGPHYDREQPRNVSGYSVSNRVRIRFRAMEELGDFLDALIEAGSNRVDRVEFGVDDPEPLRQKARIGAMTNARERAEIYAGESGGQLGRVISVEELSDHPPITRPAMAMDAERFSSASEVPLAGGENITSVQVVVKYELLF